MKSPCLADGCSCASYEPRPEQVKALQTESFVKQQDILTPEQSEQWKFSMFAKFLTPEQIEAIQFDVKHGLMPHSLGENMLREQLAEALGTTYCAYCGARFILDAPDATTLVTEHIYTCSIHPMRDIEKRLAEAEADVRALVAAIEEPSNSQDFEGYPTPWAKAVARPGVKRLMEEA